jgi:hypothetical protein
MGSVFGYWVYWHFFTITVDYNSSHIELLLNDVCLADPSKESLTNLGLISTPILSLILRPTVSRPDCLEKKKAPIWGLRPDFYYCQTVAGLLIWGALFDERTGLSFTIAAGPQQRSLSRNRVPWDSRPYFTVSDMRLPFLSPPTTRRVTVEVFHPVST